VRPDTNSLKSNTFKSFVFNSRQTVILLQFPRVQRRIEVRRSRAEAVRRTAMENTLAFAEVAGAIIGAIGLALGLEWLTLSGLIRLMPRAAHSQIQDEKVVVSQRR
jgi:hypothetical protein